MSSNDQTLDILLDEVSKQGKNLSTFLTEQSYYQPSFRPGGLGQYPGDLPNEINAARKKLRDAAKAVYQLASGPSEYMTTLASNHHDNAVLHWLVHFNIPQAVPLVGSTTYAQVATACDVDESILRRMVRYAMLNNIFYGPDPDSIAHTHFSSILLTDSRVRAMVEAECEESFPASCKIVEAYKKWSASEEPNHSAWCLANKSDDPVWEYLAEPEREQRAEQYTNLMSLQNPSLDHKHTVEGYDWSTTRGTIVDIGGGSGQTAIALAQAFPNLPQIIVVDIESKVQKGEAALPSDLHKRVFFKAHDFFHPHPEAVISAKLFLLRLVLREYSDKYARRILRNLVPALKDGGRVVVVDVIVPPMDEGDGLDQTGLRRNDMRMMQMFNGREREYEDWMDLFGSVDSKLSAKSFKQPEGSILGFMEVVYGG